MASRRIILGFVLLLLSSSAAAQNTGKDWLRFPRVQKLIYVEGFAEGRMFTILLGAANEPAAHEAGKLLEDLTYDQITDALDAFYNNPLNRLVPVGAALLHVAREAKGESQVTLQLDLERIRKWGANVAKDAK